MACHEEIRRPLLERRACESTGNPPIPLIPPIQQQLTSNPIQSCQPASKPTSLQGSKPPASKPACIQAPKHPSLPTCRIGVYHLPLGAAARFLRLPQANKPPTTGIHEIHTQNLQKNIAPVDKSDAKAIKNVHLSQNPETRP